MITKETLARIAGDLAKLEGQIADAVNAVTQSHDEETASLIDAYQRQLDALAASHVEEVESLTAKYEGYLSTLKGKAADALAELEELQQATEEALELQADETTGRKGFLPTENLKQRMAFEKLEACWHLINLDDLESYLDTCTK